MLGARALVRDTYLGFVCAFGRFLVTLVNIILVVLLTQAVGMPRSGLTTGQKLIRKEESQVQQLCAVPGNALYISISLNMFWTTPASCSLTVSRTVA